MRTPKTWHTKRSRSFSACARPRWYNCALTWWYRQPDRGGMDFGFTAEQEALRAEMRAFLNGTTVQGILAGLRALPPRATQHSPELHSMLAARGWLAIHWPSEYGGGG